MAVVGHAEPEGMDLYAAMVTTAPFLLILLLADLKAFGPGPRTTTRRLRREHHKTDRSVVGFLGVGYAAALLGLATGWDSGYLRWLTAVPLAVTGFAIGAFVLAAIRDAYDRPASPASQ